MGFYRLCTRDYLNLPCTKFYVFLITAIFVLCVEFPKLQPYAFRPLKIQPKLQVLGFFYSYLAMFWAFFLTYITNPKPIISFWVPQLPYENTDMTSPVASDSNIQVVTNISPGLTSNSKYTTYGSSIKEGQILS